MAAEVRMQAGIGREDGAEPERREGTDAGPDRTHLRLWAEEVSFDRETVETGRVRVRVVTHEHDEVVEIPLTKETVEVERVAIGREIDAIPPPRRDGDTLIVPVVEEVVVTLRKLVLKEEIRLRQVRATEQHRETVTLRRQEAVVERLPAEQPPIGQTSG
jgi:uncharacterized protein (TIGR02271 family)